MSDSTAEIEGEIKVEDLDIQGVALPAGHYTANSEKTDVEDGFEHDKKTSPVYVSTLDAQSSARGSF